MKKLDLLISSLIQEYIQDNNPELVDFISTYFKYLSDGGAYDKTINISNNYHSRTVYPELLDTMFNDLFQVFDSTKIVLGSTEEQINEKKRNLIALSKFLNANKGKIEGINLLFSFLDVTTEIDETISSYLDYAITISSGTKEAEEINEYIESVHPIGVERQLVLDLGGLTASGTLFELSSYSISVDIYENLNFNGEYFFNGQHNFIPTRII